MPRTSPGTTEQRFQRLVVGLAIFMVLDTLGLVPVLVLAFTRPGLIWLALGPYLALVVGVMVWGGYLLYRWDLLQVRGPWARAMGRFLALMGLLTGAFVGGAVVWPEWLWFGLALYLVTLGYAIYRVVRWQAAALAFRCDACGEMFQASLGTWLTSPNLGSRKYVRCCYCDKSTWASIVEATGKGKTHVRRAPMEAIGPRNEASAGAAGLQEKNSHGHHATGNRYR